MKGDVCMISRRYVLEGHDIFSYDESYVKFVEESSRCIDDINSIIFGLDTGLGTFFYEEGDDNTSSNKTDNKDEKKTSSDNKDEKDASSDNKDEKKDSEKKDSSDNKDEKKDSTPSKESKPSSGSGNVFSKIGDKIKQVCAAIRRFFSELIAKIRDRAFSTKKAIDKFEAFKKANPSEAANLKVQIDKGAIDLDAIKSLSELDKAYRSLSKTIDSADESELPKYKKKWNQIKEKFTDEDTQKVLNGAKVTVSLIAAVATLKAAISSQNRTAQNLKREHEKEEKSFMAKALYTDAAPEMKSNAEKVYNNKKYGGRTLRLTMKYDKAKIEGKSLLSVGKLILGLALSISKAIDTATPGEAHKARSKRDVISDIDINGGGTKIKEEIADRKAEEARRKEETDEKTVKKRREVINDANNARQRLIQNYEKLNQKGQADVHRAEQILDDLDVVRGAR